MARPLGSAGTEKIEFFKKFDSLANEHIDPLKFLFQIAQADKKIGRGWEKSHRLTAARELVSYRYPKLKAIENNLDVGDGQLEIQWITEEDELNNDTDNHSVQTARISKQDPH